MTPKITIDEQLQNAIELDKHGQHEVAAGLYKKILDQSPGHAWASHLLGAHALRNSHYDDAVRLISTAIESRADEPLFHFFLGHARMAQQLWQDAADAYSTVVQLVPEHSDVQLRLGIALKHAGRPLEAIDAFRKSFEQDDSTPAAGLQLAQLLRESGELDQAVRLLQQLLERHPDVQDIYSRTGGALLAAENYEEAQKVYKRLFELQRGTGLNDVPFDETAQLNGQPGDDIQASPFFFRNLIGHIRYLVEHGHIHKSYLRLADIYQEIVDRNRGLEDEFDLICISGKQADRIRPFLFRAINVSDSEPVDGCAVNAGLDPAAIENDYLESDGPMTVIDDFLSPSALRSLRNFLLESTIFFRVSHNTFVASYVDEGFSCGVLYQLAAELKQRFPRVLGDKELRNMWVYRQPPHGSGVRAHSDQAAVTFNFWITPDDSNLDKAHGGLVVYDRQQPLDWDWHSTNMDKDSPEVLGRIMAYLEGANTRTIPYRENRAVMFHSNLFHCSDSFHFREGYEHSRMNVTLLFGDHPASLKPGGIQERTV